MAFLFLIGIGVGAVSALLGIGGGVLLVPFLPHITGWSSHQVVAVSLLIILFNSLLNLIGYHKRGLVSWDVLKFWGPFAAVGSFLGTYLATWSQDKFLRLGLLTIIFLMILKFIKDFMKRPEDKKLFTYTNWKPLKGTYGLFIGTLSGFCGVGTGLISNLIFLNNRWVVKDRLAPTGNGVMFFVSLFSVLSFLLFGAKVDVSYKFFAANMQSILVLMVSVFISSFFFRSVNPFVPEKFRFLSLIVILALVFSYVLVEFI